MSDLWRDFRTTLRGLARSPGFTLVTVATLALGMGATAAVYTVVENVLLAPLPYPEPERLVLIQEKNPEAGFPRFAISPLNFRDYRAMSTSFEAMAARSGASLALAGEGERMARRLNAHQVTADYLRVLGKPPLLGRDLTAEDDRPGAAPVVLLSYPIWQQLGGDPSLVGQELRLDGRPTTVIGILPREMPPGVDAVVPLALDYEKTGRGGHWLIAFGRLKEGVTVEAARRELETVAARLATEYPDSNTGWGAIVDPLQERVVEGIRTALWILMGAVVLVLLIACTNVAHLTLARLTSREREVAVMSALGAGRWRLVRMQLLESLALAAVAGGVGALLARRGTAWLVSLNAGEIPRAESIAVDGAVLLFTAGLVLGTAVLFGLLPAWRGLAPDLADALKEGGRGQAGERRHRVLRFALVLGEVALAVVLLVGAGLLIRSFVALLDAEPGFDPRPVWTASVGLPDSSYEEEAERAAFYRRLVEEAAALPGVEVASTVMPMPLSGGDWINTFYLEGEPVPPPNQEHNVNVRFVSPGYFDAMSIPLLAGRPIEAADDADAEPVVVVNRSAAEHYWPGEEPIGRRISFGRPDEDDLRWYTVVGVVGDVRHASLAEAPGEAFYRSVLQDTPGFATVVLRAAGDPAILAGPLRQLVHRLDPDLALVGEQAAEDVVASSLSRPRFNTTLLGLFAGLALVLAALGVFGVVSHGVAERRRELGVRIALGARRGQILSLVLAQGMRPVLVGLAAGLLGALAATRLLGSLVYHVRPTDPLTYAAVGAVLAAVAACAALVPALSATRVDPIEVLRDE